VEKGQSCPGGDLAWGREEKRGELEYPEKEERL